MGLNLRSVLCVLALVAYQARAVTFNSSELYLSDHEFEITSITRTRKYDFVITRTNLTLSCRNTTGAPDGYTRPLLVINNQLPAPLIRCNEGDTLEIRVDNRLDTDVSIHWHGIWQTGTPWMDGVTGVTQCPIPPGASFTYKFTVAKQFGTFWYHAHTRNLAIDGIAGPLIIHSPRDPLVKGRDFDNEYILFMSDWYHNHLKRDSISEWLFWDSSSTIGEFKIFIDRGSKCITPTKPLEITVAPNQKTRFRLIQAGSHAMFWFSADQHFLNVTEADSTGVSGPPGLHRLQFHNGERYSVIIDTKLDPDGSSFYLRAAMDTDCFAPGMTGPDATALAIVRVVAPNNGTLDTLPPTTRDWKDTVGGNCTDLDIDLLSPLMTKVCAQNVLGHLFFNTSLGTVLQANPNNSSKLESLSRFFVDNTTWTNLLKGGKGFVNQSEAATLTLEKPGAYDIVINNLDSAIDHPLHLHGVDSYLVSHGPGNVGPQDLKNLKYRLTNPLRKDTYVVGGGSHLIVHVRNVGPFILHCHIGWHLAAGFAGIVVMQPSKLAQITLPVENQRLCIGKNFSNQNEIEPGRRKRWTDPIFDDTQPMFPRPLKGYYLPNEMLN
ncbi:multi-copper oxidase laccase-like protein [Melampsora larici-populina 98AG31]|uniref:Multi-copper oxidase laccase-like protein n=1 Tax=Melampsora larici-populina (strain 98AG31 / pathotype 3-4-7) TaxID=747676 RepID=F4RZH0_MELLP|nr:multi-copper oxidase laccase-like protein [Melampsora larici-populina 98AG31]EGG02224.1 multi-copper oxidase laccase-like protein [Melampsora larici-populina 98AG31]